jgi:hypothetical protein
LASICKRGNKTGRKETDEKWEREWTEKKGEIENREMGESERFGQCLQKRKKSEDEDWKIEKRSEKIHTQKLREKREKRQKERKKECVCEREITYVCALSNSRMHVTCPPGVNFTNILRGQLRQFPSANKNFNLYFKHKKALRKTFIQKSHK